MLIKIPGITVGCGLSSTGLIGLYFFEAVMGQNYLQMLKIMIPCLNDLVQNENEVKFQQDRAPPHFHANLRNFVDHTFNKRWIGQRRTAVEFPPQFLDLTSLDFYLWRTLKNTMCARLEKLRNDIEYSMNNTPLAIIQTICYSV